MFINRGLALVQNAWVHSGSGALLVPSFRAVYTDAGDDVANVYTFADCDLGIPDPTRMNVICVGYNRNSSVTPGVIVDGTGATQIGTELTGGPGLRSQFWRAASVANPTGTITVAADGTNCTIAVFALYPSSHTPVDAVEGSTNSNTLTLTDLAKTAGGFTILFGNQRSGSQLGTLTQTGAETITEHYDSPLETRSFIVGSHENTASTTGDDYTCTWAGSGQEMTFHTASWF